MGKPTQKPRTVSARLTDYQFEKLDNYSKLLNVSKTDILISAIAIYINQLDNDAAIQAKVSK